MNKEMRLCISSPPDREFLVAEVFVGSDQIAEINHENNSFIVEIYPKPLGGFWEVDLDSLIEIFNEGKKRLLGDETN